jgi:DNA helicase-2/ATP-dependent DNA helicase PcrA
MKMINNPKDIINKKLLCNLIEREELNIDENDPNLIDQLLKGTKFDWMISILNKLHDENELDFSDILDSLKLHSPHQSSDYYNYFFENDFREWSAQWAIFRKQYTDKKWLIYTFFYAMHLGQGLNLNLPSSVKLLTPNMFGNYAFEAVFVIDLSEGTFPDYRAVSKGEASIAEERDRLQTAVNNSKRLCYLSCAKSKEMPWGEIKFQEPSRFIANYNAIESADVSADNSNKR